MKKNIEIEVPEGYEVRVNPIARKKIILLLPIFENKDWQPQDGEVVAYGKRSDVVANIGVFCRMNTDNVSHTDYVTLNEGTDILYNQDYWTNENLRPATEAEKNLLVDALATEGKRWNIRKKCVEDNKRLREYPEFMNEDHPYFYVDSFLNVSCGRDDLGPDAQSRYEVGNHFLSRQAAERVAKQIREIFIKSESK